MFAKLLSRLVPLPASAHDHLFTTFAPEGAPPQVLNAIYHQYRDAMPDEVVPPQHAYFRAFVDQIVGANWRRLDGIELRRVGSAYVCCFERAEAFEFQLALWRIDPDFRRLLIGTRERLVASLIPLAAAESARRVHYSRWKECLATPLDIEAPTRAALIQKMSPDDWHEIVLHWDWNLGVAELDWITAQRSCDRRPRCRPLLRPRPERSQPAKNDATAKTAALFATSPPASKAATIPLRTSSSASPCASLRRSSTNSPSHAPPASARGAFRVIF